MDYRGVIIEESLVDKSVLDTVKILSTEVEAVTEEHHTPHLEQWTLYTVEILKNQAQVIAEKISQSLDTNHGHWYADFKNDDTHFIIFRDKVLKIDRTNKAQYDEATKYGISLGIPAYQLDFSPYIKEWKR
jgi:gamma-glutamyl:cysteine ligase YbdK (ATP-grasp superfamily)